MKRILRAVKSFREPKNLILLYKIQALSQRSLGVRKLLLRALLKIAKLFLIIDRTQIKLVPSRSFLSLKILELKKLNVTIVVNRRRSKSRATKNRNQRYYNVQLMHTSLAALESLRASKLRPLQPSKYIIKTESCLLCGQTAAQIPTFDILNFFCLLIVAALIVIVEFIKTLIEIEKGDKILTVTNSPRYGEAHLILSLKQIL